MLQFILQNARHTATWYCTVIVVKLFLHGMWLYETLHSTHPFPAYEPAKGERVCRGTGYTVLADNTLCWWYSLLPTVQTHMNTQHKHFNVISVIIITLPIPWQRNSNVGIVEFELPCPSGDRRPLPCISFKDLPAQLSCLSCSVGKVYT